MLKVSDAKIVEAIDEAMYDVPGAERHCGDVYFNDTALFLNNLRALGYEIVKKEPTDGE